MSTALSASQHLSAVPSHDQGSDWKRQLAERLDAYRAKHPDTVSPLPAASNPAADSRASKIARSVASRYADAPSYSELLLAAAQAEHAAAEAQAALADRVAEDARIAREKLEHDQVTQQQMADAQAVQQPIDSGNHPQSGTPVMPRFAERTREMHLHQAAAEPEPSLEDLLSSAMVEPRSLLPSKLIEFPRELVSAQRPRLRAPETPVVEPEFVLPGSAQLRIFEVQPETAAAVEAELPPAAPEIGVYLPAGETVASNTRENLPRTRSRTVTAEPSRISLPTRLEAAPQNAPLQRPSNSGAQNGGHKIGSSRAATPRRSAAPAAPGLHASPARAYKGLEWAAISLDQEPGLVRHRRHEDSVADSVPFLADPASIDRRLMAFAVDFAAVTAGFLGFLAVFAACTPHLPTGLTAVALGGAVYGLLWLLYQTLFFSLSGATAGMLYARIALCTFDDQNPTRSAMRRRLAAWWLSCLPLGMGFLWCFVDEDNLSWHDRMTRIYQRAY